MKRIALLAVLGLGAISLVGCMPPPPQNAPKPSPQGTQTSLFQQIYPNLSNYMPRRIEGVKPQGVCPKYIKVWVGSYSDKKGDYHEAHWEWLKISDCKPQTNF